MMQIQNFQDALRNNTFNRIGTTALGAGITMVSGEVRVNGAGEAHVDVIFPTSFVEKPLLSFGAEVIESDALVPGFMPTISVIILGWTTQERPPTSRLYTGATLGVVTGGVQHQKMIVHWKFEGIGLGPV